MSTVAERLEAVATAYLRAPLPVRIRAWDGSEAGPADAPTLEIRSPRALRRLVWAPGELGAAQAYVTGEIDLADDWPIEKALQHCVDALQAAKPRLSPAVMAKGLMTAAQLGAIGRRPAPPDTQSHIRGRLHTRDRDRSAISHHYDFSNHFYELVLDPSMAYSCGYHATPDTPLAEAQTAKLDLVCRKLGLTEGSTLLDVGCGWGSLSLHAAEHFGARVVGVTIAAEQKAFIDARIAERGLADRVEIRLQDYRDVPERDHFDAVASIEMGEHVGQGNYPTYASVLRRSVRPGGRVLVQQMSRDRTHPGGGPFIESFIAPDMYMRPVAETQAMLADAGLEVRDVHCLREHYSLTALGWIDNIAAHREQLTALVGEESLRVWDLYMHGGVLAFTDGRMSVEQFLMVRPDAPHDLPLERAW